MFPLMIPMLYGAALGGLSNKKDPLKGALLGAGMGAGGGAMMGAGAAGAAAMGPSLPVAGAPLLDAAGVAIAPASTGLLGSAAGYVKPLSEAAGTAQSVMGLLGDGQQTLQSHAPQSGNAQGAQTLSQLYQQGTQMSPEDHARLQRKTMWG